MNTVGKKYRFDELIAKTVNKADTKKELMTVMGIKTTRMNEICRATFQDDVNVKIDQLWEAATFFQVAFGDLVNPPPHIIKRNTTSNEMAATAA